MFTYTAHGLCYFFETIIEFSMVCVHISSINCSQYRFSLFTVSIWIENAIISKHMFPMFSKQHWSEWPIHMQCVTNTLSQQIQKRITFMRTKFSFSHYLRVFPVSASVYVRRNIASSCCFVFSVWCCLPPCGV